MKPKELIKIRNAMRLRQEDLARELKVSTRYLTSREIGEKPISEVFKRAVLYTHEKFKSKQNPTT